MIKEAVTHQADSNMSYLTDDGKAVIILKAAKGDLSNVVMYYDDRYDRKPKADMIRRPLEKVLSDELHDYFRLEFACEFTRMSYFFSLTDSKGEHSYFSQDGFSATYFWSRQSRFQMPYWHREDSPHVPKWLKESLMYQIFPDSFANGKESLEPKSFSHIIEEDIKSEARFGGSLKGITESIPYIKDLGINLIYLNPIFAAKHNHKYETINYFDIDPCLGTKEDFRDLVETCHRNDIRIILDLVINQTSVDFFAFRDVLKNQEKSRYADWYHIHDFPVKRGKNPNYETFAFYDIMPKLNTSNPEVEDYLLDIGRYWIKEFDIDGYRLDVSNEVSHEFWRRFRREMDKMKDDFAIIGEVWHEASSWLGRDQFHGVMNFPLMTAVWEYFAFDSKNALEFSQAISRLLMKYPKDNAQAMMNFIDNHDVGRFLSISEVSYDRQKMAIAYIMTCVGFPSVYYGDEKAMEGVDINDSRRKMIWDDNKTSASMHDYYKKIISIRRENPVLVYGDYKHILADPLSNQYGFIRSNKGENEKLICLFNNSPLKQDLTISVEKNKYTDLMTNESFQAKEGKLSFPMTPFGVYIIKAQ